MEAADAAVAADADVVADVVAAGAAAAAAAGVCRGAVATPGAEHPFDCVTDAICRAGLTFSPAFFVPCLRVGRTLVYRPRERLEFTPHRSCPRSPRAGDEIQISGCRGRTLSPEPRKAC